MRWRRVLEIVAAAVAVSAVAIGGWLWLAKPLQIPVGGSAAGNNRAESDNWPKLLAFLDAALKPVSAANP